MNVQILSENTSSVSRDGYFPHFAKDFKVYIRSDTCVFEHDASQI